VNNYENLKDPWGHQYQYLNFDIVPSSQWRKDITLNPLNTDYDLWSNGKDGQYNENLSNSKSHDDIIRAHDGSYVGLAKNY